MNDNSDKVILAGGSGFLGRLLAPWFGRRDREVVVLARSPQVVAGAVRGVVWDGATLAEWWKELNGAAAVINLAGRSVNCRYHARNRRAILDSRLNSTRVIGAAIGRCDRPPPVWLNSSTATIYKHSFDQPMDEATGIIAGTREAKDEFSIEVATAWERTFEEARTPATRKVAMRTAMVLGLEPATVFRVLRRLTHLGLGGKLGSGRQYVSWIHEHDFCRAVELLIEPADLSGPVNLAAPHPLPNREMMQILRQVCGVLFGLPAARWMLEVGAFFLRTETELILKSRRVVPRRLLAAGFEFEFPDFRAAATELEQRLRCIAAGPVQLENSSLPCAAAQRAARGGDLMEKRP
ncbi:MAG TPA: TIGR01777 family oxidoreductase [Phycisphaerae bacterium]|jgi:hypothetical protein